MKKQREWQKDIQDVEYEVKWVDILTTYEIWNPFLHVGNVKGVFVSLGCHCFVNGTNLSSMCL